MDRGRTGTATDTLTGTLFVVATPIGNLEDITARAANVLRGVGIVAAEDTRRSRVLLASIGASPRQILSLGNHNESASSQGVLGLLLAGQDVALVSDAGTPLVSDPGFELVRAAVGAGVTVVPVPGVSAVTAALSVCPLPVTRFRFEGFLPAKKGQRQGRLAQLADVDVPLVCFESARRLADCLEDVLEVIGDRQVFLAKEITKIHETFIVGSARELHGRAIAERDFGLGEYVLVIAADASVDQSLSISAKTLIRHLCDELPPSQAARIAAHSLGIPKSQAYEFALSLRAEAAQGEAGQ